MSEQNKALARRYFEELWSRGNLGVADEILDPSFVFHGPGVEVRGPEAFKQLVITFRTAFPDLDISGAEYIAEQDKVASCFTLRGTQRGEFQGIPPTGRPVAVAGTHIFRIAGGKIEDIRISTDTLGMLQQLGVLPAPGEEEIPASIR
jgi:predicted ester cyclase